MEINTIAHGDALACLRELPDESVHCCVTSPPYWGLRDYGVAGQLGLEKTPEEYVAKMVEVFREVRRVLRNDGTLWLNLGDSYASSGSGSWGSSGKSTLTTGSRRGAWAPGNAIGKTPSRDCSGFKSKDLIGIPWRVAFALQADGWWLRQDIIWHKPNTMPESVRDRCTKAHEYIFMLSKSARYYYDADAIKEPGVSETTKMPDGWDTGPGAHGTFHRDGREKGRKALPETQSNLATYRDKQRGHGRRYAGFNDRWDALSRDEQCALMRNKRSVWTVATAPFKEAHFATFPPDLITPCILAGCPEGGTVLDPFGGSGTTAEVALKTGRKFYLIELSADYIALAQKRIRHLIEQGVLF